MTSDNLATRSMINWKSPAVAAEHNDLNQQYFEDGTAGTYPYFFKLKEVVEFIVGKTGHPLLCLDVGCGAAWLAKYLFSVGTMRQIQYEGLDISESMCEYAKKNCPEGTYHVADILSFDVVRRWDLVMACGSIERFVDWKPFLCKLAQLSSSWIIIHKIFFTDDGKPTQVVEVPNYDASKEFRIVLNFVEFSQTLEQYGFVIEKHYNWSAGSVHGIIAKRNNMP